MQNRIRFVGKDLMKYINYINKKIDKKSSYRWRRAQRSGEAGGSGELFSIFHSNTLIIDSNIIDSDELPY